MDRITGRLEDWYVDGPVIWGSIYEDVRERWPDGTHIHTSNVCIGDIKEGGVIETLNSTYLLGRQRSEPKPYPSKHCAEAQDIDVTLAERGARYGSFDEHARITQAIKACYEDSPNWNPMKMRSSQREALDMIAHKIGRILNGDPNYDDSWRDIAGYAELIVKELNGEGV